ncbi:MAG TPA: CoA pyrophosphatase [Methylomirabilota bacterium]|nr:CoA pyrophosphatase [Methylomirabilota bacterium]
MTTAELAAVTRARLASRERRAVVGGTLVKAAVLIPIVERDGPALVFAKRTDTVGQHAGQISFPGGRVDPNDAGFLEAALREAHEEVALPVDAVEPLGALDDTETVATQFIITPWVGLVRGAVAWKPDGHEIERVIEVPFARLTAPGAVRVEHRERDGLWREMYFWDLEDGDVIWGATARILKHYLDVVAGD